MTDYRVTGTIGDHQVDLTFKSLTIEEPEPVPFPDPVPDPTPAPEPTPDKPIVKAWAGETVYLSGRHPVNLNLNLRVDCFQLIDVETSLSSFKGATAGKFFDAMRPISYQDATDESVPYVTRVKISPGALPGTYDFGPVMLEVQDKVLPSPDLWPLAMYMEVQSFACLRAYMKANNAPNAWGKEGQQVFKFCQMLREFGIEPFKQEITPYPENLNVDPWGNQEFSYRRLVFDTAIHQPLITGGLLDKVPPPGWLHKLTAETAGLDFLIYGIDELGTGPSGVPINEGLARIDYLNAESSRPVIQTGVWHDGYSGKNVEFWPVRNYADDYKKRGIEFPGTYGSCMATGSCSSGNVDRTNFPVHVLEGDPVNDWQRSVIDAARLGCSRYMHFSATKKLTSCWEVGGLWNEGGNGDGTHFYYDPDNGDPWPSVRLMHYHIALQKVAKGDF